MTAIGSKTEDLDPINHTLPEADYTNNYQGQFHKVNNRYQGRSRFHSNRGNFRSRGGRRPF